MDRVDPLMPHAPSSVRRGRRKSVAANKAGDPKGRRKSVMATTPKEMGAQALETSSGTKMGSMMWARMPPKHEEQYEKGAVVEASSGTKVKVKLPDGSVEEYSINDLLPCNTESDLEDV